LISRVENAVGTVSGTRTAWASIDSIRIAPAIFSRPVSIRK
jgi:hypothetical protein